MPYLFTRGLGALTLPQAIFRQEGSTDAAGNWNPSSLGYRLNNPGNLNYAGQPGCHPTTMGNGLEAQCDTLQAGIDATNRQLALDASRGLTLQDRLSTWATGNKAAYVANVSSWMGVDPSTPLSDLLAGAAGSDASIPAPSPADSSSAFDWTGTADGSQGVSSGQLLGLALAGSGLLLWWAAS